MSLTPGCSLDPSRGFLTAQSQNPAGTQSAGVKRIEGSEEWRLSQFYVTDLKVIPLPLKVGENARVQAMIYVPGIVERYANAYLSINGEIEAVVEDILIYGDETIPLSFDYVPQAPGTIEIRLGVILQEKEPYVHGPGDLVVFIPVG